MYDSATPWILSHQIPLFLGFPRQEYWSRLLLSSLGDLPSPGIEPRSPTLQVDSLPAEPQEKPKNTGVGSLSLLQRIFLTQKLNWGLLHCRQILYQLSYQGSLKEHQQRIKASLAEPKGYSSYSTVNQEKAHHSLKEEGTAAPLRVASTLSSKHRKLAEI